MSCVWCVGVGQSFQLRTAPARQGGEAGHKIGCGLHCIGKLLCEFCTVCCVCSDFKKKFLDSHGTFSLGHFVYE